MRQILTRWSLFLLIVSVLAVVLTSCTAFPFTHEIESTVLMRTLGVDVGTESMDGVAVTASAGERPGAGTQQTEPAVVLSAQGGTITAACQRIQSYGDQYVFLGDVEQLLIGEGQAQRSLSMVLEHVGRDRALRLEAQLWVVRGGAAADVLFLGTEDGEKEGVGDRLAAMGEDAGLFSAALPKTAREALVELAGNGSTFVPALTAAPRRPGDGGAGDAAILPAGYAIFRDGALAGYTDADASRGVNLLVGRVDTDVLEVTMPDQGKVGLKITGARVRYAPTVERGRLTGLVVRCKIEADLAEVRGDGAPDQESRAYLEEQLAQVTQERMMAAVALAQRLNADFLALRDRAALAAPWYQEIIEDRWAEEFSTLSIAVEVEGKLAREEGGQ